jgi:hypothetical protein
MMTFPMTVKIADLKLADTVELFEGAYGTGTVSQIKDGIVTIMRPYGATAEFSYTGGVIFYTGLETCTYLIQADRSLKVYSRKELK